MTTMPKPHMKATESHADFALNELAAQLLDYVYDARNDLRRVLVFRADGQPSEFNPCFYASQTVELLEKAIQKCETRFRAQLLTLIGIQNEVPIGYEERIIFCLPHTRKITLAALISLQEHAESFHEPVTAG